MSSLMNTQSSALLQIRLGIGLLAACLLVGCAVLKVDVDVYKGALSNQQDVQAGQLAAIIISAQPLMVNLTTVLTQIETNPTNTAYFKQAATNLKQSVENIVSLYTNDAVFATAARSFHEIKTALTALKTNTNNNDASANIKIIESQAGTFLAFAKKYVSREDDKAKETQKHLDRLDSELKNIPKQNDQPAEFKVAKNSAESLAQKIIDTFGGEFGTGFESHGLTLAISNYLFAAYNSTDQQQVIAAQKKLLVLAVDLGEKIKFFTDNDIDFPTLDNFSINNQRLVYRSKLTLQAIGNSILTLADSLYHKLDVNNSLAGKIEWTALNKANVTFDKSITNKLSTNGIDYVSPKEAFDFMIQELKDIHVSATLNGDQALAERAKSSLQLAQQYRTGHISIDPAMIYLRASYPATSLQQNDDGLWRNMLDQQNWRSLPYPFNSIAVNGWRNTRALFNRNIDSDAKIQADIDKQNWQTINRIRVAGSGFTSYVLVKDDIGNWYVKSYKSDPTPIIEGAKSALIFANADKAMGSVGKAAAASLAKKSPAPKEEPGLLARQMGWMDTNYCLQTREIATNLAVWSTSWLLCWNQTNLDRAALLTEVNVTNATNFSKFLAQNRLYAALTNDVASISNYWTQSLSATNQHAIAKLELRLLQHWQLAATEYKAHAPTADEQAERGKVHTNICLRLREFTEQQIKAAKQYEDGLHILSQTAQ